MKRLVLFIVLIVCTLLAFPYDYYRVKGEEINARQIPGMSGKVVYKYRRGEMLQIAGYKTVNKKQWGQIANTNPPEWVALSNLERMSREDVSKYINHAQKNTVKPKAQPKPKQQTKSHRSYVSYKVTDYIIIVLKVLVAIYALVFFILLYKEAKKREKLSSLYVYGFCCLALWFWVIFPGKWQWLWVGVLWPGLCYPLAYSKWLEKNDEICVSVYVGILFMSAISTWFFLQVMDMVTMYVGPLVWYEWLIMAVVNLFISGIFGGSIMDRCPLCHYFCDSYKLDQQYNGSSYYDVVRHEIKDYWDHKEETEDTITNYYRREKTRITSTYRKDRYISTYYCPHCHGKYKLGHTEDNLVDRQYERY